MSTYLVILPDEEEPVRLKQMPFEGKALSEAEGFGGYVLRFNQNRHRYEVWTAGASQWSPVDEG